ncbi:unnamed protein product [Haemonchus placei]|uniref:ENTH domain-containing protein n=1 Tax=Haemonchus placei TaxID=6290 RepID=A0A0N4WD10_HAEPC|nr:unnamed protein product [Haemonchus placei]
METVSSHATVTEKLARRRRDNFLFKLRPPLCCCNRPRAAFENIMRNLECEDMEMRSNAATFVISVLHRRHRTHICESRVSQQCRENIFTIETLKDFQHIEDNRDQGLNIREKAKQITALLTDEERLKNERTRFMLTRTKFRENSGLGSSSERRIHRSDTGTALGEEIVAIHFTLAILYGHFFSVVFWFPCSAGLIFNHCLIRVNLPKKT